MEQSNANLFLLHSEFKNVVTYTDSISSPVVCTVDDWMNVGPAASDVPLAILTDGIEPFSFSGAALQIGGVGTNLNNTTYMVSKKVFKYNPYKYYRVHIRARFSSSVTAITAGFVGLTSYPVPDLVSLNANIDWNGILNTSRCAFSPSGTSVVPVLSVPTALTTIAHFNCIQAITVVPGGAYQDFVGVIMGKADGTFNYTTDPTVGPSANNPMPVRNEVLFVAPYFIANMGSNTRSDGMQTVVDFITVEELTDTYVI
jgi:hypothetical protein